MQRAAWNVPGEAREGRVDRVGMGGVECELLVMWLSLSVVQCARYVAVCEGDKQGVVTKPLASASLCARIVGKKENRSTSTVLENADTSRRMVERCISHGSFYHTMYIQCTARSIPRKQRAVRIPSPCSETRVLAAQHRTRRRMIPTPDRLHLDITALRLHHTADRGFRGASNVVR